MNASGSPGPADGHVAEAPAPASGGRILSIFEVIVYLVVGGIGVVGVNVLLLAGWMISTGTIDPSVQLPTSIVAATSILQFGGMVAAAALLAVGFGWWRGDRGAGWLGRELKSGFGFKMPGRVAMGAAFIGGLTVGWFPSWFAGVMKDVMPSLEMGAVSMINDVLTSGTGTERFVMIAVIAVLGPLAEELVFRGYLWRALRRGFSAPVVLVATSLLFAAFHLDPVQALPLVFTGLFLGWLRMVSGSVWPAVLAHVINNALGVTDAIVGLGALSSTVTSLGAAALTIGVAIAVWKAARTERQPTGTLAEVG